MGVALSISVAVRGLEFLVGDLGTATRPHEIVSSVDQASGTASSTQDLIYSDTIAFAGSPTSLDLAGVLTAALGGAAITMVEVRGFCIRNKSTTSTHILGVGNGTNPAYAGLFGASSHIVNVAPGGILLWTAPLDGGGLTVTAGTGDVLKLDPGANTFNADIIVWGVSA